MTDATRNLLEQHFHTAFAAPDGIAKLRELILTLAMQGKLVEQDPSDPPALELLKEIEKEKASHEGTKTRRGKEKKLPPVKAEEVPYELPLGWEWVRLGEIGQTQTGTTPKSGDNSSYGTDIPFIKPADIRADSVDYSNEGLSISGVEKYGRLAPAGSSLMVCIGTIGKTNIINRDCSFNQQINAVTPYKPLFPSYIQQFIRSSFFQAECWKQSSSTTIAILNKGKWESIPVALPPLPEQHRIVVRIDQLMARCDELEKLRREREEKRLAVHAAAIKQLIDPTLRAFAPSSEKNLRAFVPSCETKEPFTFLSQHFGELYTVKENVAELRKAILQLAVMGRLVPQDPNDPPARELLKEIEAEKQRLVKAGKIKKPKPLPPIKPEEVPYQLPQGWEWVRLGMVAEVNGGFAFKSSKYSNDGVRVVRISDFDEKGFKDDKIVRHPYSDDLASFSLETNNILMAMTGGTVGKSLLVKSLSEPMVVNQRVATIKMIEGIAPEYINGLIRTNLIQSVIQSAKNSTNDNISMGDITGFFVPLPPLPEQHRIVARIDQLMTLCDNLDQQIDSTTEKQTALLNAVMAQV